MVVQPRLRNYDYNIARIKTQDDHWYISTFYSQDNVIIDYNIARIKTPDDHWYISTFYSRDYVIIVRSPGCKM
jgi:hypothetical protein